MDRFFPQPCSMFKQDYHRVWLYRSQSGFTLLELLVALSIFSVIAIMAYSGLNTVLKAHEQTSQQSKQLAKLQMAIHFFSRDIQQFVNRPIRNEYGDLEPAMYGANNRLSFTHAGWHNPTQQKRSQLRYVQYFIENQQLWYRYWMVLDRAQDTQAYQVKLLDDIEDMQFRFLSEDHKWLSTWVIEPHRAAQDSRLQFVPPTALEITLKTQRWGEIRRLFTLPALPIYATPTLPQRGHDETRKLKSQ